MGHSTIADTAYYLRLTAESYPHINARVQHIIGNVVPPITEAAVPWRLTSRYSCTASSHRAPGRAARLLTRHDRVLPRHFGQLHLAVLPGETVLDGYFTGFASDVAVSVGRWRWVRTDLAGTDPSEISLKDPSVLYKVVTAHSQYDAPLTLADITEET